MNSRRLLLVCALLAWVVATGCAGPGPEAGSPPAAPLPLRVVCWNIHHARGLDGAVDPDRIGRVLAAAAPDVVCMQEVDVGVARTDRRDLVAEVVAALAHHGEGTFHGHFGHNLDYQGGRYGNAILVRDRGDLRITDATNHRYRMLREGEQRGALFVELATPVGPVQVVSTHLDYRGDPTERLANLVELAVLLQDHPGTTLLAGDFNDVPGSVTHERFSTLARDLWMARAVDDRSAADPGATYPAATPAKRIDWIGATGPGPVHVERIAVLDPEGASDHRPVLAVLQLAAAPGSEGERRP